MVVDLRMLADKGVDVYLTGVLQSYLCRGTITFSVNGRNMFTVDWSVLQESVLSLLLRNVVYDGMLRLMFPCLHLPMTLFWS